MANIRNFIDGADAPGGAGREPSKPMACTVRCVMSTAVRVQAGQCLGDIPEQRVRRAAVTCSPECFSEYRRLRRNKAAEKACRLCGRAFRRSSKLGPVRSEHTPSPAMPEPGGV